MSDTPKKSLGQHWLYDEASLEAMVEAAEVGPEDTVLEIGPGLGTLTKLLTQRAGQVIAIELDQKLANELPARVAASNLQVIIQDILEFDFTTLPADYKLVANIPYYLTGHLLRLLSETSNPALAVALLVQKEVAQRVCAEPGALSILGITTQFYWQASLGAIIPAELFTPPPKIDSQILILQRRPTPLFNVEPKDFFRLVKAGFAQPRKTLLNNLSNGLKLGKDQVQALCQTADIDPTRRAQTLSLPEWHQLYQALHA